MGYADLTAKCLRHYFILGGELSLVGDRDIKKKKKVTQFLVFDGLGCSSEATVVKAVLFMWFDCFRIALKKVFC